MHMVMIGIFNRGWAGNRTSLMAMAYAPPELQETTGMSIRNSSISLEIEDQRLANLGKILAEPHPSMWMINLEIKRVMNAVKSEMESSWLHLLANQMVLDRFKIAAEQRQPEAHLHLKQKNPKNLKQAIFWFFTYLKSESPDYNEAIRLKKEVWKFGGTVAMTNMIALSALS